MEPLKGILVLDVSRVLAGPYCTMILGDLGADIIKIEQPGSGDETRQWGPPWAGGESAYYLCTNRNKKSVAVNMKHEAGRKIIRDLGLRADVLVENFLPGKMAGWGLGYRDLCQENRGLIYCSITGYGQTGPYRSRPGYDFILQAQGGIMSINGPVDGAPHKVGVAIVDMSAGLYAAIAILAALHERQSSGEGQYIDIALLESQLAWLANVGSNYLISGEEARRYGNAHPNVVPYETFRAQDRWFALGVGNDRQFQRMCSLIGDATLAADPRYVTNADRVENRENLIATLAGIFATRPADEWLDALGGEGIPCAPINTVAQALAAPHLIARGLVLDVPHPTAGSVRMVGSPLHLSRTPVTTRTHPPLLGEHTEEVLRQILDCDDETLRTLRADQVIN